MVKSPERAQPSTHSQGCAQLIILSPTKNSKFIAVILSPHKERRMTVAARLSQAHNKKLGRDVRPCRARTVSKSST